MRKDLYTRPAHKIASQNIAVARIIKERGIKGEIKAFPLSTAALSLPPGAEARIVMPAGIIQKRIIMSIRPDREFVILSFQGLSDRNEASKLRNALIEVDASILPELGDNEYYHHQIIGLSAVTADGEVLGKVQEIMEIPGNEVYVVQGADRQYLIPAVKALISQIDLDAGIMTIMPIEGLLD